MEKAKVIANAAGVSLGKIISIDYNWGEVIFQREEFCLSDSVYEPSIASLDIQPDDIEATDTVSIMWEIS